MRVITLSINGQKHSRAVPPSTTLVDYIREELNLTGTKKGCDLGECGCCTVLVDGQPLLSCLTLAADMEKKEITTIEGIADGAKLHPVQEAFVEHGALQCGYCTPAMILNAVSLLENNPKPCRKEIKECVSGTICRCTGYTKIEEAIEAAAAKNGGGGA